MAKPNRDYSLESLLNGVQNVDDQINKIGNLDGHGPKVENCERELALDAVRCQLARDFNLSYSRNLFRMKNPQALHHKLDDTISRKAQTGEAQTQSDLKNKTTRIEATRPTVLFLNTKKEVLSSAPTSPNSSGGESPNSTHPLETRANPDPRKRITKLPPSGSWRKRRGLMLRCGPFFGRPQPGTINSPYQSDVSQSAPSSPTIDTYETLPLVPNAASIARVPVAHELDTDYLSVHKNALLRSTDSSDSRYEKILPLPSSTGLPFDNQPRPDTTLLCLMQRLGVQSVWPCLLEHGIADVRHLSKLTRNELIEMGVTDAETRATLMTAAQLLTDSWLNSPFNCKPTSQIPETDSSGREQQNLRDSGISSGTDFGGPITSCSPNDSIPCDVSIFNQSCSYERPTFHCRLGSVENITNAEVNHLTRNKFTSNTSPFSNQQYTTIPAPHMLPQTTEHIKQKSGGLKSIAELFGISNSSGQNMHEVQQMQLKQPIGILRNARGSRDNYCDGRNPDSVRRSSSTTPKTVKIDERFLTPPKEQRLQPPIMIPSVNSSKEPHYIAQFTNFISGYGIPFCNNIKTNNSTGLSKPAMNSPHPAGYTDQLRHMNKNEHNIASVLNHLPSSNNQTNFLRTCLREKLQTEGIDLTKSPYSDEVGKCNIPLRLIQRYSFEIQCELTKVALAIEAERDAKLREAGRPVVSFVDDIQSQRFLNCEGIKTGNLQDFLIGIGLPMYVDRMKLARLDPNINLKTPSDLLKIPDEDLIHTFGFTPAHVHWLRHEAAAIPWTLLAQSLSVHTRSGHNCSGFHTNSLQRSSSVGLRSASQTRKMHKLQTQIKSNTYVPPDNFRDKV